MCYSIHNLTLHTFSPTESSKRLIWQNVCNPATANTVGVQNLPSLLRVTPRRVFATKSPQPSMVYHYLNEIFRELGGRDNPKTRKKKSNAKCKYLSKPANESDKCTENKFLSCLMFPASTSSITASSCCGESLLYCFCNPHTS